MIGKWIQKIKKNKRQLGVGALALLLVGVMGVNLLQNSTSTVYAQSDTNTGSLDNVNDFLGADDSTQYAGRIWTDKSVSEDDVSFDGVDGSRAVINEDEDFLVTYSALATSQTVTGKANVPVDVVFVIDNSNSMDANISGNQSRLEATVEAVNNSIDQIMNSNSESRVAVVIYGLNAATVLPLGHYSPSESYQHSGDYIWITVNDRQTSSYGSVSGTNGQMDSSQRGTNIHRGVDEGFDILKSADNIGTGDFKHVPALVLLSDGAASAAGAGDWWNPNSNRDGNGKSYSTKYDFKTIMNAQYNKQQVNLHYGLDSNSDNACKVYTIGMGLDSLTTGNDGYGRNPKGHAQITLDPGTYIYDNNDVANAIQNAWEQYNRGYWNEPTLDGYTFEHPNNNDITTIEYNDGYYAAENADDVADVFDDITSDITSSVASVPTQTTGNVYESGWLEYVDPLGDYMQIGEFKELVYGNQVFRLDTEHSKIGEDGTGTYVFSGVLDNGSGIYNENVDVNNIDITVSKEENANNQIATIRIPAALIPVRVNNVDTDIDGTVTNNNNGAKPIRLVYSVKTSDSVLNENGTLKKTSISDDYIANNKNTNGTINLYSNSFEKEGSEVNPAYGARVTFTPAQNNPYYFLQEDTLIYSAQNDESVATYYEYRTANPNTVFYIRSEYYEGTQLKVNWVERTKAQFEGRVQQNGEGKAFIERGTTRVGNLTDLQLTKTQNSSQTSDYYFYPVENGDGSFTVYLGNNGVITKELSTSLSVAKIVEAKEGFTLPEANATFTFNVSADDFKQIEDGKTVKATRITTIEGQDPVSEEVDYVVNKGTAAVTLEKNQKVIFDNLKQGTNYKVEEVDNPAGYTFKKVTVNGVDNDSAIVAGTLTVDDNHDSTDLVYTNEYGASPITVDPTNLELGGTKEITGRNFENGDNFTFVLRGANNAPMPEGTVGQDAVITLSTDNGGLTIGKAEASFEFTGDIQYNHPGTYQYYLVERNPETPISGINYDSTRYRLDVIVDPGNDGNLHESHKWYKGVNQNGSYQYVEMQTPVEIKFTNDFSASSDTLNFSGTKIYNKTLSDGMFAYRLTGNGNAPMPKDAIENVSETTVDADGNIEFGAIIFTDDMIGATYTYTVEEILPDGVDKENPTKDGITYDTTKKTITVTVSHDGAYVKAQPNGNNFTFKNEYNASGTVSLTGTKTIEGREFKNGDSFKFTVTAKDNAPQPTKPEVTINPTSGTEANISFGDITFTNSGQFEYEIKEEQVNTNGITSDPNTVIVRYNVTDNGNGTLNAVATYTKNRQPVQGVEFVNTYAASSVTSGNIEVQKTFTGLPNKWRPTDIFGYTISGQEGAPLPERTTIYIGQKINEDGTVSDQNTNNFGTINFIQAGEYSYQIKEIKGNIQGVTYDGHTTLLTINVIDDLNGQLVVGSITYDNSKASNSADQSVVDKAAFTNIYSAGAVTFENFNVRKTIDGREWLDGETYSFTLSKVDRTESGEKNLTDIETIEIGAPEAGVSNTSKFSPITIDAVGSYEYEIREDIPSDAINGVKNGITYDTHVYTVKFDVYDPGNGTLAVRNVTYDGVEGNKGTDYESAVFTNKYTSDSVTLTGDTAIHGTKTLTGRNSNPNEKFNFTLTEDENNNKTGYEIVENGNVASVDTLKEGESAKFNFGDITFTKNGTYTFYVSENIPENAVNNVLDGVTYDSHVETVSVNVTEDYANHTLVAEVTYDQDGVAFTNTYDASASTGVPTEFSLTKVFEGKTWTTEDVFEFTLTAGENTAGIETPMPANPTVQVNAPTEEDGKTAKFDFGSISYDTVGDYHYTVTEVQGNNPGINYSENTASIIVHVSDNQHGGLVATAEVENGIFTNTYSSELDYGAQGGLQLVKNLTGHDLGDGQFGFTLNAEDSISIDKLGQESVVVGNTADDMDENGLSTSTITLLDNLKFTQKDVDKTYTYTVRETKGGSDGYTNDETIYTVKITTEDNGSGTLTVRTHITGTNGTDKTYEYSQSKTRAETGVAQIVFENTYKSTTDGGDEYDNSVTLTGTKELTGRPMVDGEFSFQVLNSKGQVVSEATNGANGEVVFNPIHYTNTQLISDAADKIAQRNGNKYTYVYTVNEVTPVDEGTSIVKGSFTVTVNVTDNGDGTLTTDIVLPEGGLAFKNAYGTSANAEVGINGTKYLDNNGTNAPDITGKYTFTITGSDGAPMPAVTTATNDASGYIDFGTITYTMENVFGDAGQQSIVEQSDEALVDETTNDETLAEENVTGSEEIINTYSEQRTKTFTYTITETGNVTGVTNDPANSKAVEVTVTDNGDGTISVSSTQLTFSFTNTYTPDPTDPTSPTDSSVTIKKTLEGKKLSEKEFTFNMLNEAGEVVSTGTNTADGSVTLSGLTFDKAGTYNFTIAEVNDNKGGVEYDNTEYKAIAYVEDDATGKLKVSWEVTDAQGNKIDMIEFKNTYSVNPTSLTLGATKVLEGRELGDKEFLFVLSDEEGNVVEEAYNDATGKVEFSELVFDKAGTYNYTVTEKNTGAQGITYDDSVYNIQVEVVDNGNGTLNMKTTTKDGEVASIVFRNKAEKDSVPEQPEKGDTSNTSTQTYAGLFTSLAVDAVALAGIATLLKKRNAKK